MLVNSIDDAPPLPTDRAEADREITMRDLMVGTRRESAKMGRLVDVKQFGPYAHLLDTTP